MAPGMSSRPITSQQSRVLWRRPLPSEPSTRTTGRRDRHLVQIRLARGIEADSLEAALAQRRERVAEIAHDHERHVLEASRGGFRQDACRRRAVPGRRDDGLHIEGRRRADDGAHIVRVGDLVESQDHARCRSSVSTDGEGRGSASA